MLLFVFMTNKGNVYEMAGIYSSDWFSNSYFLCLLLLTLMRRKTLCWYFAQLSQLEGQKNPFGVTDLNVTCFQIQLGKEKIK